MNDNTVGTKKRVATVANMRPPMTARPNGVILLAAIPNPKAIGIMR